ncbi:DUF6916 family protein [Granulicella arctica]|uniref:DUF6916 domain-containing protein n=1 Tax=Granulicella arctica TaxID=940613 RepID=A0A7Y9PK76_9BACT|nr:hypothetical protein [Granulicella arctica]NYF80598.1 hypothetical protein [Granulicella arctica]
MHNRRHFLVASAVLVTGAAFPTSLFASRIDDDLFTNTSLGAYSQGLLTQANFEHVIGSQFTLLLKNNDATHLYLRTVEPLGPQGGGAFSSQTSPAVRRAKSLTIPVPGSTGSAKQVVGFHLTFSTESTTFDQGTYLIDHGTLGRFALFLVPGNQTPGSCGATFTSLAKGET